MSNVADIIIIRILKIASQFYKSHLGKTRDNENKSQQRKIYREG